jgi:hypothetical protein
MSAPEGKTDVPLEPGHFRFDPQQTWAANLCRNSRRSEAFIREHYGSVPRSLRTAPQRNRPGEIDGDRPGQRHAAQLTWRCQPCADDLAVVEL